MKTLNFAWQLRFILSAMISLTAIISVPANGQEKGMKNEIQSIIGFLEEGNYKIAVDKSHALYNKYPTNSEVCLILGLGYINLGSKPDSAVFYLKEGIKQLPDQELYDETGINLQLSLAKAHQLMLNPYEAVNIYNNLLSNVKNGSDELTSEINREKEICANAQVLISNPIALKIKNLGDKVNSPYDDHSPLISINGDKLYFTSRRDQINLTKSNDGQYPEKICFARSLDEQWEESTLLKNFFKRNDHESAVSLSADGKKMFLFRVDIEGKNLYQSNFMNGVWGIPKKLPEPINSYSDETHCSLSADESTMFFTSDREDGLGGLDIYMSKKQVNGLWGDARNLGPNINTPYDEEAPMIYMDGRTLYFASEGHNSMGMFDIFYSVMNADSTWSAPVNLGFPINTPGDDSFFVPTIDRNRAYYSTSKFANNKGGLDIYEIEFDTNFKGELAVVEGKVDLNGVSKTMRILVSRADNQELVGDYRPDPITGSYLMFLEVGERYQIKEERVTVEQVVVGEIEVTSNLSYNNQSQIIVMNDIAMQPPLSQTEHALRKQKAEEAITANLVSNAVKNQAISTTLPTKPATVAVAGTTQKTSAATATASTASENYTIQLLALKKQPLPDLSLFNGLDKEKIKEFKCVDGYFRYTYSTFESKELSLGERNNFIQTSIFKDAFVRPISQVENLTITISNK